MHSFMRHLHSSSGEASTRETKGLVLDEGWRYDLAEWFHDTFSFRGKWRQLRQRTATLARIQLGDAVLDVPVFTNTHNRADFFTHTTYWDTDREGGRLAPHIVELKRAVNLADA